MTNKLFIILLSAIVISIIGCAGNCETNNKLSGTLYVAGNEPFTYLAIATDDEKRTVYRIECSDSLRKELWQLQGNTIELNCNEIKKSDRLNTAIVNGYSTMESENKRK